MLGCGSDFILLPVRDNCKVTNTGVSWFGGKWARKQSKGQCEVEQEKGRKDKRMPVGNLF